MSDSAFAARVDATKGWRGRRLASVAALALFAAAYLVANLPAPMQRDGAHFVLMANDIAHGQAPYWASFETKNPLVEIYWSPFLRLLAGPLDLVQDARVAEAIWIALTAALIFLLADATARQHAADARASPPGTSGPPGAWVALIAAALYLLLALDVRVTDDGLNIALYQALPELALLWLLLRPPAPNAMRRGALVGLAVFSAWFVKQSSLLPAALMLAAGVCVHRRSFSRAWWTGAALGAALPLGAFALHLLVTDTWANYWLGTHEYRASLIPTLRADFMSNALRAYDVALWRLDLGAFLAAHRIWTGIATVVLTVVAVAQLRGSRRDGWTTSRSALLLATAWMVGAWAQAVAGLTFFPHYFLASLAPVATVLALLSVRTGALRRAVGGGCLLIVAVMLAWSYRGMREDNLRRALAAPINHSVARVLPLLRPGDRIFNWSGLPHVLVAHGTPSAYPLNMYWPYIMTGLPADERARMLARTLQTPPDVVVAIVEQYPANQHLASEAMTAERLATLTGQRYAQVLETPPQPGRYGAAVQVFRREAEISPPAPR